MPLDEAAKLAFMRWLASLSDGPWVPRREAAEKLWDGVRAVVEAWVLVGRSR